MTRASFISALALSVGLLSAGCGGNNAPTTDFATVQQAMVSSGCTLAPCHGASAPSTTKLKATAADSATCKSITDAAANLIDKSNPAGSRLVTYPSDAMHTGGKVAGWMSATDTQAAKAVDWIKGGAPCP